MSAPVLIVEDRKSLAGMLAATLKREGYAVEVAYRGDEAVARLAGHLKRNGPPGWLLLAKGYWELLVLERGWLAREAAGRCAES